MRHVEREARWRWLIHALHVGRRNNWRSRWFCFVCADRRYRAWAQERER
jgi:hypothetical protein